MPSEKTSKNEAVGESLDDQPAQPVAFGVDQPVRIRRFVQAELPPQLDRLLEPLAPERFVDRKIRHFVKSG